MRPNKVETVAVRRLSIYICRVAADSKRASSLRSLPQLLLHYRLLYGKFILPERCEKERRTKMTTSPSPKSAAPRAAVYIIVLVQKPTYELKHNIENSKQRNSHI